jgi:hypothetical protein
MYDSSILKGGLIMQNLFRDFIYMDTERLKSIVAQLNQGLLENTIKMTTDTDGGKINAGLDFLKILKVGSEASFLWQNQSTESHTLHDYLYNMAESSLRSEKHLINIPGDINQQYISSPNGEMKAFNSTSFILVKGKTIINDFTYMKRIIDNFDEITKSISGGNTAALKTSDNSSKGQKNRKNINKKNEHFLQKDIKKSIQTVLENFYKDRVVIKNVPFSEHPNFRFVGTLNQSYLRESIENIIFKYGTAPRDEWYMLAQIASIPNSDNAELDISFNQNELEQGMQTVFDALRGLETAGLSISFPEIAVTPIAIYRQ